MHGLNHVHRRGAVYVWRRRLPKSLGADQFLQVSLRTTNFFSANRLAALVNAIFVTSMREVKAQRISIAEARCLLEAEVAIALKLIEEERYYEPEATSQDEWRKRYFDEKCRTAALRIVAGRGRGACILDEDRRKLVEQGLTEGHLAQVQQEIDVLVQELGSAEFTDDLAAAVSDVTGRDGFSEPDLRYAAKVRMKARADAMMKADRLTCEGPLLDFDDEPYLPRRSDPIESPMDRPAAKPIRVDRLCEQKVMTPQRAVETVKPMMPVRPGSGEKPAPLKPAVRKDGIEELKALYFKSLDRRPVGDEHPKTIAKDLRQRKSVLRQRKSVLRHFSEAISAEYLADLTQSDLSDYVETMSAIPKIWGRNKEDRERTVHELIERAEELPPEEVGLAPGTLNRNLGIIEAFLTFARAKRGITPKAQLYFSDLRADTARGGSDLPLNFHPATTGARLVFTPVGAG